MKGPKVDQRIAKVILFAVDVIEAQWDDCGPSEEGQMILDEAEALGFIHWRKPTPSELADGEWWGHEFDIGPETAGVGELSPDFRELKKAAKSALSETV